MTITLMFCSNQMQMFPTDTSHLASADKVTLRKQLHRMRMDIDDGDLHLHLQLDLGNGDEEVLVEYDADDYGRVRISI